MSRVAWVVMAAWATACSDDDPTAVCLGDAPVQLLSGVSPRYEPLAAYRAGDYTFLRGADERGDLQIFAGPACGVEAVPLYSGIPLFPLRVHEDPRDDDPTLACDASNGALFRVDPHGEAAPTLLLPHLRCTTARATDHGLLVHGQVSRTLWLYPEFPDTTTARSITTRLDAKASRAPLTILGDELAYVDLDGVLRSHDLATGAERTLLTGVADFAITPTHLLWREVGDDTAVPVHLHDRASGADIELGLHDPAIDDTFPTRVHFLHPWLFDPTGAFVLHIPDAPSAPMAAFDLAGQPALYPPAGSPRRFFADGTMVYELRAKLRAARPGHASVALDVPPHTAISPYVVGDRLELRIDADLHEIPLDGAPRRTLVRDVGKAWIWLDDRHLLTVHQGELTRIDAETGDRDVLDEHVTDFSLVAGGVYYTIETHPDDPRSGLWHLPEAALRPAT
jgi:hypothetical protein